MQDDDEYNGVDFVDIFNISDPQHIFLSNNFIWQNTQVNTKKVQRENSKHDNHPTYRKNALASETIENQ